MTAGQKLRWVVAGGGTGGHVTPALALAERIAARGDEVLLLGTERGLEKRLVPEAGFELLTLPARQLMGKGMASRLAAAPALAMACASAWRMLGRRRVDLVISVGGYASVPAVVAAAARRLPIAVVEPNAVPGRANRAASRLAARIFVQFEEAAAAIAASGGGGRVRTAGIPLRAALISAFAAAPPRRAAAPPWRLLVFGGSQGATQLNDAMLEAIPALAGIPLEIFHQTGAADRDRVAAGYARAGVRAEVATFEPEMPRRYRWADVALCRAGALTVAELCLAALPSVLVPYPHAADDHQRANARALARVGAARVLEPATLSGTQMAGVLRELFAGPGELSRMSAAAGKRAQPDAAERIVAECAEIARARRQGKAA
ncbi:MAG TPA: undecaprenyldiphospho-muramoylpentapeptide beta-N-acetylglucosaminyltransferase [Myxococcota bacterium]|jgi:UDP-N-acetylglucosamine--N-acetylmuramyl-(pentapeptide) pyrophosphoryl-undecaprenol N-acetylglucosamine transferase